MPSPSIDMQTLKSKPILNIIGLMSGTSLDGVDVAWLETDGKSHVQAKASYFVPYPAELREKIRACFGKRQKDVDTQAVEQALTFWHEKAVQEFMQQQLLQKQHIDMIGFHGQTITHDPDKKLTIQLGDGQALANATGMPVAYDFRTADVAAGGQGAPLLPVYHRARVLSAGIELPTVILNIGGVSNITWIGADDNDMLAFDTGPGNALIDDYMLTHTGHAFDENGNMAATGNSHHHIVAQWCEAPYFKKSPPKSLDRDAWKNVQHDVQLLSQADAVATLTSLTVEAIYKGTMLCPQKPKALYVGGGGRKNVFIMQALQYKLGVPVLPVDTLGWDGDSLEAEGFAYLAARSFAELPLSFPGTTSVPAPQSGGKIAYPASV